MAGSGTFAIEAATMAKDVSARPLRKFALMRTPLFVEKEWQRVRAEARPGLRSWEAENREESSGGNDFALSSLRILASDRDRGAAEAIRSNAARAGVEANIQIKVAALGALEGPNMESSGVLIVNPPYGDRVGKTASLQGLYRDIGGLAQGYADQSGLPWTLAIMMRSDAKELRRAIGHRLKQHFVVDHGGIKVMALSGQILPSGGDKS